VAAGKSENREPTADAGQTSSRLTNCEVIEGGKAIRLGFLDHAGNPSSVSFPFEQAESIVMTLPQMLAMALQLRTHDQTARFVFPLGRWSLESGDRDFLIANLMTNDGFRVSFAVPFDACKAIGLSLFHQGQSALQERDKRSSSEPVTFN
jgi:hypothetical protein